MPHKLMYWWFDFWSYNCRVFILICSYV